MEKTKNDVKRVKRLLEMANEILHPTVTESALVRRLNRKLNKDYRSVRKSGKRAEHDLGTYYLLDTYNNSVVDTFLDLEEMGKQYEVLDEWEKVAA